MRRLRSERSNPLLNISITFDRKTHSSFKAIARAFNRHFTASTVPQDLSQRKHMREVHQRHFVDLNYRPFDERIVAAALRNAGSSSTLGPEVHIIAFLKDLFNLSIARVIIIIVPELIIIILILKAGKPREQGRSYHPISLHCQGARQRRS